MASAASLSSLLDDDHPWLGRVVRDRSLEEQLDGELEAGGRELRPRWSFPAVGESAPLAELRPVEAGA